LKFSSRIGKNYPINMTVRDLYLADGFFHSVQLMLQSRLLQVMVDGELRGEELDSASSHDFLDPYLTHLSLGGFRDESFHTNRIYNGKYLFQTAFTRNGNAFYQIVYSFVNSMLQASQDACPTSV